MIVSACSAPVDTKDYSALAQCMTTAGATMYGTEWCSHCKDQKAMFGAAFQYIDFVDCDLKADECKTAGVEGFPTWNINGTNYPGTQNLYILAVKSGCVDKLN